MKKNTYYHAVTIEKIKSIMKYGLVKNISDNGVYFTDDAVSSLDWIKCREELWFGRKRKSYGLVIFETNLNDSHLENFIDYNKNINNYADIPKKMKDAQQSEFIIYRKSIHPSQLKFEECFVNGDDYDCVELENKEIYKHPTRDLRIKLMVEGMRNILGVDTNGKLCVDQKMYKKLRSNKMLAENLYEHYLSHWREKERNIIRVSKNISRL